MGRFFVGAILFGFSTVAWSDVINVDQSMSVPVELAAAAVFSFVPADPVMIYLTYTDYNTVPFLAILAKYEGSGWIKDTGGSCEMLIKPNSTSASCTANDGFLDASSHIGFGIG